MLHKLTYRELKLTSGCQEGANANGHTLDPLTLIVMVPHGNTSAMIPAVFKFGSNLHRKYMQGF